MFMTVSVGKFLLLFTFLLLCKVTMVSTSCTYNLVFSLESNIFEQKIQHIVNCKGTVWKLLLIILLVSWVGVLCFHPSYVRGYNSPKSVGFLKAIVNKIVIFVDKFFKMFDIFWRTIGADEQMYDRK